jgi:hypothetical protein
MRKIMVTLSVLITALFGGYSFAKPHMFSKETPPKSVSPALLDEAPPGKLETATFALG